uniref:PLAG1 like zinc finger 1 n=1 Tax=Eptatretus burgeri TaxID=7764 RepID=A0A8C4QYX0_EPTBU
MLDHYRKIPPQKKYSLEHSIGWHCVQVFVSVEKLRVHSYAHTGERPFACTSPGCSKAFVSKYKLLRHAATHSPDKTHACPCCGKTFHRKDHLKNHQQTHDPHKLAYRCDSCGKKYHTKLGFRRHLALHAAASGDLTCRVCGRSLECTAALLQHLKAHASKPASSGHREKRHQCDQCGRQFYTRKDVRRHLVVHTGRKDFACTVCGQRFGRKDHLTRHAKKSHEQQGLPASPMLLPLANAPNVTLPSLLMTQNSIAASQVPDELQCY